MAPTQLVGSRAQVWHGTALKTAYGKKGLKKSQLKKNKHGKIVSVRASNKAKKKSTLKKWMKKEGLCVKKGKFGLQKTKKHKAKGTRKKRCRYKRSARHGRRHRGEYKHCVSHRRRRRRRKRR